MNHLSTEQENELTRMNEQYQRARKDTSMAHIQYYLSPSQEWFELYRKYRYTENSILTSLENMRHYWLMDGYIVPPLQEGGRFDHEKVS